MSGPVLGAPARDRYYATRLRELARIDLDEAQAEELWNNVAQHRRGLQRELGRDVGQRVALLDYIVNVRPQLVEPQIIEKTRLEEIEHQAVVDALTGLYNRHRFDTELTREAERSMRYGGYLSLLLLDLDQFKSINDGHGHASGDQVLHEVGAIVSKHVRAADVACRFGGDEFAVILPDTPVLEALVVAERILINIDYAFQREPIDGCLLRVTASGGVADFAPGAAGFEALLADADAALYDAKHAGGNRIVWRSERIRQMSPETA